MFDTVRFELQGKTVTLSGQVLKESLKQNAERMVRQVNGVESVVNHIEVLPESRRDDALRMNVYRAIYEKQPLQDYSAGAHPLIHIIVKNGWVTLEGVVDSEADRSAVRLRALKATAHVSDNLRVAPEEFVAKLTPIATERGTSSHARWSISIRGNSSRCSCRPYKRTRYPAGPPSRAAGVTGDARSK